MKYPTTAEIMINTVEKYFGEKIDTQMKELLTVWTAVTNDAYEQGKRAALATIEVK